MFPLFAAGLSLLKGFDARAQADAQNVLYDAEAYATNTVRTARNKVKVAESSLATWMQSENNNRKLKAAGTQYNAAQQTLQRFADSETRGSLEDQLSSAEAAGAYAANVAMTGTAGGAVDMIASTMALRDERKRAAQETEGGYATYDMIQQAAGIIPQSVAGLDISSNTAGLDYSHDTARKASGPSDFMLLAGAGLDYMKAGGELPNFSKAPTASMYSIQTGSQPGLKLNARGETGLTASRFGFTSNSVGLL